MDNKVFFAMGPGETGFGGGTMTIDKSQINGGMSGVDLQGYNIEGLDLTGDSFETGQDSGGHDIVDVRMTLVVRGEWIVIP